MTSFDLGDLEKWTFFLSEGKVEPIALSRICHRARTSKSLHSPDTNSLKFISIERSDAIAGCITNFLSGYGISKTNS